MRLPERDRYPLAGPLAARRRAPSRRRRGGGGPTRSRVSRVGDFWTFSGAHGGILWCVSVRFGVGEGGAVAWLEHGLHGHTMQSREGTALQPQCGSACRAPDLVQAWAAAWLAAGAEAPGARPVFWKLCSDRRARWAGAAVGLCGRFVDWPYTSALCNGRPANRSRQLDPPSGAVSRGLRGSSRRLCSRGPLGRGIFLR